MIQTIDIDGIDDEHPAKSVYGLVSETLTDLGYSVDLTETLSGEMDKHGRDVGLTLELSKEMDNFIRDGRLPFTLQKHLEGYFGESTGSANVTTIRLKEQMNISEVLTTFEKTGQLADSIEVIDMMRADSDPSAETILAYTLGQYAKGWLAEEIAVNNLDGLSKGSVSQDEGGIDFYYEGDMAQLGSITRVNSKKKQMESSDIRHLIYQWTSDGKLVIGDMDEVMAENKRIAKSEGLSATLIRRSAGNLKINREVGRSFRYLWW
jgi:hypothetical protein